MAVAGGETDEEGTETAAGGVGADDDVGDDRRRRLGREDGGRETPRGTQGRWQRQRRAASGRQVGYRHGRCG
ncbi:hypothetical protein E2562_012906 [Oryza meyeriana var. granulata]|uniref:Uncharacterized protein n=1 Tax=Oryza meyeriana var. granulata TaxID=110450 RepID=A0A6G1CHH5_9ORYZ|nr:hypothetical protein E2562_012906 [Oryza meyeriana var. granulata]